MTPPFRVPPGFFPAANVLITPPDLTRFCPDAKSQANLTWENDFKALYPITNPNPDYIGRSIHVWKTPWSAEDGWGTISGLSQQNSDWLYTIPALNIPSQTLYYRYTIASLQSFTLSTLWARVYNEIWYDCAGAIRFGSLWLDTPLDNLTHNTQVMHFRGIA